MLGLNEYLDNTYTEFMNESVQLIFKNEPDY